MRVCSPACRLRLQLPARTCQSQARSQQRRARQTRSTPCSARPSRSAALRRATWQRAQQAQRCRQSWRTRRRQQQPQRLRRRDPHRCQNPTRPRGGRARIRPAARTACMHRSSHSVRSRRTQGPWSRPSPPSRPRRPRKTRQACCLRSLAAWVTRSSRPLSSALGSCSLTPSTLLTGHASHLYVPVWKSALCVQGVQPSAPDPDPSGGSAGSVTLEQLAGPDGASQYQQVGGDGSSGCTCLWPVAVLARGCVTRTALMLILWRAGHPLGGSRGRAGLCAGAPVPVGFGRVRPGSCPCLLLECGPAWCVWTTERSAGLRQPRRWLQAGPGGGVSPAQHARARRAACSPAEGGCGRPARRRGSGERPKAGSGQVTGGRGAGGRAAGRAGSLHLQNQLSAGAARQGTGCMSVVLIVL